VNAQTAFMGHVYNKAYELLCPLFASNNVQYYRAVYALLHRDLPFNELFFQEIRAATGMNPCFLLPHTNRFASMHKTSYTSNLYFLIAMMLGNPSLASGSTEQQRESFDFLLLSGETQSPCLLEFHAIFSSHMPFDICSMSMLIRQLKSMAAGAELNRPDNFWLRLSALDIDYRPNFFESPVPMQNGIFQRLIPDQGIRTEILRLYKHFHSDDIEVMKQTVVNKPDIARYVPFNKDGNYVGNDVGSFLMNYRRFFTNLDLGSAYSTKNDVANSFNVSKEELKKWVDNEAIDRPPVLRAECDLARLEAHIEELGYPKNNSILGEQPGENGVSHFDVDEALKQFPPEEEED